MNFIFVSLQRINTDRESTSTSLAKELAKSHNVLYVNPPIDRKAWWLKSDDKYINQQITDIKTGKAGLQRSADKLWILTPKHIIESINWIPFTPVFSLFNRLNNNRFAKEIKAAAEQAGFEDYIIVNDKDIFRSYYLKEILKPKLYVYLDRDYTLGFEYWRKHGSSLEPKLMKKSDLIVCNSLDFTKNAKRYNQNSFYIGNGCDLSIFDPDKEWEMPGELKVIQKPVIGYVGALNSQRLDINLMARIAKHLSNYSFVFIGPEDENFKASELHQISNIFFIEKKHTQIIPGYISYFDVCINPQLINEITIGNFPLKIIEYLAMGKPVVATVTNTMTEVFSEHCYLAVTAEEFVSAIDQALENDSELYQLERIRFSKNYSWENVSNIFINAIKKVSNNEA